VTGRRLTSVPTGSAGGQDGGQVSVTAAAGRALVELEDHLARSSLAPATAKAYQRAAEAYTAWLLAHRADHADAFVDVVGAEGAVTAWRRHLLDQRAAPSSVNQTLAAITLMYSLAGLRIAVTRVRVPRPGEPDALTVPQQRRLERAADRRGPRDAALISVLLHAGPRVEEVAGLDLDDVVITARTGTVRFLGKGSQPRTVPLPAPARDRVTAWIEARGREPGALWWGQRGRLTISGITQAVLAIGTDAGLTGLRPHQIRHTYATRLRQGGADPAQIQALLGHASLDSSARYFRAGAAEVAAVVERVFQP
jgi:integrase